MLWTVTANYERALGPDEWGDTRSGQMTSFMVDAYSHAEAESKAVDILTRALAAGDQSVTLHMNMRPTFSEAIDRWADDARRAEWPVALDQMMED